MTTTTPDLWTLVLTRPEVDLDDLAAAIAAETLKPPAAFRAGFRIRDGLHGLSGYREGASRWDAWLHHSGTPDSIEELLQDDPGEPGFPTIAKRLMRMSASATIRQFLRDVGTQVHGEIRLVSGGASALVLPGSLRRQTDDIDVVNEVPSVPRSRHALLKDLKQDNGRLIALFRSVYLPAGRKQRLRSLSAFGDLQFDRVDVHDVFPGKLFRRHHKDLDERRAILPQLTKVLLVHRLQQTTTTWLAEAPVREQAVTNGYILFGEELPA